MLELIETPFTDEETLKKMKLTSPWQHQQLVTKPRFMKNPRGTLS